MAARLYSVTQSHYPYDETILVGHNMNQDDADKLRKSLTTGCIGMVPSSDYPNGVVGPAHNDR